MSLRSIGRAGESHHWSGDRHVVVDLGGYKNSGLDAADFDPDIVILTHSDSDHIGGAPAFFAGIEPRAGRELWLPYEWAALAMVVKTVSDSPDKASQSHPIDITAVTRVGDEAIVVNQAHRDLGDWLDATERPDGYRRFDEWMDARSRDDGRSGDNLRDHERSSLDDYLDYVFEQAELPAPSLTSRQINESAITSAIADSPKRCPQHLPVNGRPKSNTCSITCPIPPPSRRT